MKKQGVLFKNTVMLYILTFSNYLFSFITVPFQTRILGPEVYGEVGFVQAIMVYVQMVVDFGFILSSTEDVAKNRDNDEETSKIMSSVFICKLILGVISFAVMLVLCFTVERFKSNMLLFVLFFFSTLFTSLLPDFLYRGKEIMAAITYRAVGMKAFFTLGIFLFLRNSNEVYLIPLFNLLGGIGACLWTYWDVYKNCNVKFVKVSKAYVKATFMRSSSYFLSRIASTVYGATNTLLLGFVYPSGNMLGYYTSAEKLMTTARSMFSPIADSLYPYMVKNKDYKMVKKILLLIMPFVIIGCSVVGIYSEEFCSLLFGEEFAPAGNLLKLLMPVIAITLPTYICGFPMLSPLGLGKYANYSVIAAAIFHGSVLLVLLLCGALTTEAVCIVTTVTELMVLCFRVFVILKHKMKNKN